MTNLPKFEHFSDKISFTKEEILKMPKEKYTRSLVEYMNLRLKIFI